MFSKQALIIVFSLWLILSGSSATAQIPSFQEYQERSKKLAEKNPSSYVEKAYTGIGVTVNSNNECEVVGVEKDSPGYKADVRIGDIILSVDGVKITSRNQLFKIYDSKRPGETISGKIRRNGKIIKKNIVLESIYMPYDIYVLTKELVKDVPIRLAIIIDEVNAYGGDPQAWTKMKGEVVSIIYTGMENMYVQFCQDQSNCYVIDRRKIELILNEIKFQTSSLVSEDLRAKIGQLSGATHLLIANVTLYNKPQEKKLTYQVRRKLVEVQSGKILSSILEQSDMPIISAVSIEQELNIYNSSLMNITGLSKEAMDAYSESLNKMRTDKEASLNLLTQIAIPKHKLFIEKLKLIYPSTTGMKSIHNLLIEGHSLRLEAFRLYKSALENRDRALFSEGDAKIRMSNEKLKEWTDALNSLQKR